MSEKGGYGIREINVRHCPGSLSGGQVPRLWGWCRGRVASWQCRDILGSNSELRLKVRPWGPSPLYPYCLWACLVLAFLASLGSPSWTYGQSAGHICGVSSSKGKRTCSIIPRRTGATSHEKAGEIPHIPAAMQASLNKAMALASHAEMAAFATAVLRHPLNKLLLLRGMVLACFANTSMLWPWALVPTLSTCARGGMEATVDSPGSHVSHGYLPGRLSGCAPR